MPMSVQKIRNAAYQAQCGRCFYCNYLMWLTDPIPFATRVGVTVSAAAAFRCTAEHLRPRCEGGTNSPANIVAACYFCNSQRHRRKNPPTPSKHQALIARRLAAGRWHQRA